MPEWRGWKECDSVTLIYREENKDREQVERFEDVLVACGNGLMTIKKGQAETYVRMHQLDGWELVLKPEPNCKKCGDGRTKILFNDPNDIKAKSVEVPCPDCHPVEHNARMRIEHNARMRKLLGPTVQLILEEGEMVCPKCGGGGTQRTNSGPSCPDSDFEKCSMCCGMGKVNA